MNKSIFKEIIIMLLLCLAILLVLGVLFYDYIPSNKIVPNKVAYTTPENVSQELTESVENGAMVNITYQLDDTQLDVSKKNKEYDPGKQNPFDSIQSTGGQTGNTANGGANGTTSGNVAGGTSGGSQSGTNSGSQSGANGQTQDPDANAYLPTGGAK